MRQKSKIDDMPQNKSRKKLPIPKSQRPQRSTYADYEEDEAPIYKKPVKITVKKSKKPKNKGY